jgi:cytochrome P450
VSELDLTLREVHEDPYPTYARLRAEDPVHWSHRHRSWFLLRFADCETFFRSDDLTANRFKAGKAGSVADRPRQPGALRSIGSDPPEHTAVRALAQRGFTAREVEVLRPRVEAMTERLLDAIDPNRFDLIADFAYPLPITVIAELFGVPEVDRPQFQVWSRRMAEGMDHFYSKEKGFGAADLSGYIANLVAERKQRPGDDLISRMLESEGDDALNEMEVMMLCTLLVFAGHETTTNLIGNGMLAMFRQPDQLDALRRAGGCDSAAVRLAVEELLRFDSPAQIISRAVARTTEIGGTKMEVGDTVVGVIGAANRDPAAFTDPDRLDLRRQPNHHLAFGAGIHFCLGAALSRREAVIALPALLERFPSLQLAGDPVWRPTAVLRGLESLPVTAG